MNNKKEKKLSKKEWALVSLTKRRDMFVGFFPDLGGKREKLKPYPWQLPPLLDYMACAAYGRDTGKSSILMEGSLCWNLVNVKTSLFTAFDTKHLKPVIENVIENFKFRDFLSLFVSWGKAKRGRANDLIRDPSYVLRGLNSNVVNGSIPGAGGTGVLGFHVYGILIDEVQDYTEKAWNNLQKSIEEKDFGVNWHFKIAGVSNGTVNTPFYNAFFDEDSQFKGHRYNIPSFFMPDYSFNTHCKDLSELGGFSSAEYEQNILGLWGTPRSSLFPVDIYEKNIDDRSHPVSKGLLNHNYRRYVITKQHENKNHDITTFLNFRIRKENNSIILKDTNGDTVIKPCGMSIMSVDPAYSSTNYISCWFKIGLNWWNLINVEIIAITDKNTHSIIIDFLNQHFGFNKIVIDNGGGYAGHIMLDLKSRKEFQWCNYDNILLPWLANQKTMIEVKKDPITNAKIEVFKTNQAIGIFNGKEDMMEGSVIFPNDLELYRNITGVKVRQDGTGRPETMTKFHAAAAFIGFEYAKFVLGGVNIYGGEQKKRTFGLNFSGNIGISEGGMNFEFN